MKIYLTETTLGLVAALLIGSAAFAGPFGLPDHQRDGFRDTGCDEEQRVEITNEAGELLYTNNPTCPNVGGAGISADNTLFNPPAEEEDDNGDSSEEPEPEEPIECKGCEIASE